MKHDTVKVVLLFVFVSPFYACRDPGGTVDLKPDIQKKCQKKTSNSLSGQAKQFNAKVKQSNLTAEAFMAGEVRDVVLPVENPPSSSQTTDSKVDSSVQTGDQAADSQLPKTVDSMMPGGVNTTPVSPTAPLMPLVPISSGSPTDGQAGSTIFVNSARSTVALQVSLELENDKRNASICTGVLIANNVALTAAHCFVPVEGLRVKGYSGYVYAGTNLNVARGAELFRIAKVAVHPDWNGLFHDIAIVTTQQALPSVNIVPPFVKSLAEVQNDRAVYLMGFGVTSDTRTDSGKMRWTESSYFGEVPSNSIPGQSIVNQIRLRDASGKASQACTGDSGGPAFSKLNGKVLGIVSGMNVFIQGKLTCDQGDVNYTYVQPYFSWIQSVVGVSLQELNEAKPVAQSPLFSIDSKQGKEPTDFAPIKKTIEIIQVGANQKSSDASVSGECLE